MTVPAHPLHWPTGWPRARSRDHGKFGQRDYSKSYQATKQISMTTALDRLQSELDRLGARGVVLSSNLERNLDGSPRARQAQPHDPGVAVYFVLKGKDRVLACDRWFRAEDNIAAVAKHIEAIRGMERWGVGSIEQAFAGYQRLAAPEQWWQVLGVSQNASRDDIQRAYRAKARTAHPDAGGSDAAMARINAAREAGLSQ